MIDLTYNEIKIKSILLEIYIENNFYWRKVIQLSKNDVVSRPEISRKLNKAFLGMNSPRMFLL